MMTLEELNQIKEQRGYSIAQIAEYSGVPLGTVRKIFTGETRCPRQATIQAIERVLNGAEEIYAGKSYTYGTKSSVSRVHDSAEDYKLKESGKSGGYTLADYFAIPEDRRAELIDGQLYTMETPTFLHQKLVGEIHYAIEHFIRDNKGTCQVITAPSAVQLNGDDKNMLEPDLYIICDKDKLRQFGVYGAPDYVLEVLSASTRTKDLRVKIGKYTAAGVREIWYLDPVKRVMITYYEGNDWMPEIHQLEGRLGMDLYEKKLQIDLERLNEMIDEFGQLDQ